jgi:hypothetical protein
MKEILTTVRIGEELRFHFMSRGHVKVYAHGEEVYTFVDKQVAHKAMRFIAAMGVPVKGQYDAKK